MLTFTAKEVLEVLPPHVKREIADIDPTLWTCPGLVDAASFAPVPTSSFSSALPLSIKLSISAFTPVTIMGFLSTTFSLLCWTFRLHLFLDSFNFDSIGGWCSHCCRRSNPITQLKSQNNEVTHHHTEQLHSSRYYIDVNKVCH